MAEVELTRQLMRNGELDTAEAVLLPALDRSDWFEFRDALDQVRARQRTPPGPGFLRPNRDPSRSATY